MKLGRAVRLLAMGLKLEVLDDGIGAVLDPFDRTGVALWRLQCIWVTTVDSRALVRMRSTPSSEPKGNVLERGVLVPFMVAGSARRSGA
jgi:hypothetical protein